MEAQVGLEPTTCRLQGGCTTNCAIKPYAVFILRRLTASARSHYYLMSLSASYLTTFSFSIYIIYKFLIFVKNYSSEFSSLCFAKINNIISITVITTINKVHWSINVHGLLVFSVIINVIAEIIPTIKVAILTHQ